MFNNFRYYVKQAFSSLFHNALMSFTSIFTVVSCMLILSIFLVLTVNLNFAVGELLQQCELQAYVPYETSREEYESIGERIRLVPNVAEVVLCDKNEQLNIMKELFAEDADVLDGMEDDNPFRDSFKITLTEAGLQNIDATQAAIAEVQGVQDVDNRRETVDALLDVTEGIKTGSFWGIIMLGLVAVFIIANTIKITVFSRRKEINVMKFVGATDWFIRWPFVIEGILIGLIGALIAFGLVAWGYNELVQSASEGLDIFPLKSYNEIWAMLCGTCIAMGCAIGAIGSSFAVRKHLQV